MALRNLGRPVIGRDNDGYFRIHETRSLPFTRFAPPEPALILPTNGYGTVAPSRLIPLVSRHSDMHTTHH